MEIAQELAICLFIYSLKLNKVSYVKQFYLENEFKSG